MNRDWRMLKMFYGDNGDEEIEPRDFTEKELLEYIGPDSEIRAEFNAFLRFRDEEALMEHVKNYEDVQLRQLVRLFSAFSLHTKTLIVGLAALERFPDDPELLTLALRAARHVDRGGAGQHLLVKLIFQLPRSKLGYDGCQEALLYLLPNAYEEDRALCRELFAHYKDKLENDHRADLKDEIAYWLLLSEMELALGNREMADSALGTAFEKLPPDWKALGGEVSSEQLREMIDRCYQFGRDYMKEFEWVNRAWALRRKLALQAPEEV